MAPNDQEERTARVDISIAKQLQRSMELNARMKNRLRRMADCWDCPTAVKAVAEDILKDQEPAWPAGSIYGEQNRS